MSDPHITYSDTNSPNNTHYSHNTHSFNTHISNDFIWNVNNASGTDERSEILAWLSPLEPRIRHQDIQSRRADSVGEWLLQTDEFQKWCDGAGEDTPKRATLFCCGDPAVGKTYFSSLVVDSLCDKAKGENIAVACFYVDFAAREEQPPTNILGSLLKQIISGLERIPDEISRAFQDCKKVIGGRGPRVREIVKMIQAVTSLRRTFICVDALDECVEVHRPEVLDSLRQITDKSPNTRIFLTGRRHILCEIEKYLSGRAAVLSIKPNNGDITSYVRMRLSKDTSLGAIDSGLEAEIIGSITENIPETFLLISLTMDAILGEPTASGRRRKLRAMTNSLDLKDVYGATLERVKELGGEKARLGMAALMWISNSERLLKLNELLHALAVEIGSTDLDPERIPSVETLLSCCLGLVFIDEDASIVRLIHFTLQEYLYTCPDLFGTSHSIMAETCLTYLNFRTIKELSYKIFVPPHSTPFLEYSSLYWGAHARRDASRDVISLAFKLFGQIETHISTKLLLLDLLARAGRYNQDMPTDGHLVGFTGLHCASVFGVVEIANALIGQKNHEVNKRDFLGITPLIWASICGHEKVTKLLLEQRTISPNKPDTTFRRTALLWAAWRGQEGVVRTLLGRASAKYDGTDGWWTGVPRVMNVVMWRRYVDASRPDKYGQTPLSLASEEGHSGVVKLLLGIKDVKPDAADGYGRTPLLLASSKGQGAVVKLLVEREDVDINKLGQNDETPLSLAAMNGHDEVVGRLLGRKDINPDLPNNDGRGPLSRAAGNGRNEVVKLLLGREDVNPDMRDNFGRTPFSWAAENGCNEVVELLLVRKDVNPDIRDNCGQTPLSLAAGSGRNEVVAFLLAREDVNPDTLDINGQTSLSHASRKGHDGVVKLLLGREGVNPDRPDDGGRTPLSWAAWNGRDEVVKLLLGRGGVNPDRPDDEGQTPLSHASRNGHDGVVKLLLGREGVNPDKPDDGGRTPLSWAAWNGCDEVVKLLLGQEDINPDKPENSGRTPLSLAAMSARDEVVKILLEREDVNPDKPDNGGRTPLSWTAGCARTEVVELLLGREDVNPNMPDNDGRTPLSWAAMNGRSEHVGLLLGRENVNPDMPDNDGRTPLSWAAERGHYKVVKLLSGREDVNSNIANKDGLTPLSLASKAGNKQVMKLLQAEKQ